jgi:hypothetical protein
LTEIKLNYLKILIHNRMHSVKAIQLVPLHSKKVGGVVCCKSAANHWPLIFPRDREL